MADKEGDERHLIDRARRFDQSALEQIYITYYDAIFRYISARVQRYEDAEDLTHEVFVKMLKSISSFKYRGGGLKAWLFTIAKNTVIDYFRRMQSSEELSANFRADPKMFEPEEIAMQRLFSEQARLALLELTPEQRQLLILRFGDGLDPSEIAAVMGKSKDAIYAMQHRALASLAKIIRKLGVELE